MTLTTTNAYALDHAERPAVRWANYRGNVTGSIRFDQPMGPNTLGERMWPVEAVYDPESGKSRVGFSYIAPTGAES